jgi:uncharacterized membrane protein
MRDVVGIVALLLVGAISGTLFGVTWLTGRFPRLLFAQSVQEIVKVAKREFPPLAFAALVASIVFAVVVRDDSGPFVLALVTALSMLATIVVTVRGNVPLNIQIEKWSPTDPPSGWEDVLRRWMRFNLIRTAAAVLGFAALAAAVALS